MAQNVHQKGQLHQLHQERIGPAVGVAGIRAEELQEVGCSDQGEAQIRQVGVAEAQKTNGEVIFLFCIKVKSCYQY